MHAHFARFITTGGHHTPVAVPADEDGQTAQLRAAQQLDGDEEGIEIEVKDGAGEQGANFKTNVVENIA